MTTAVGGPFRLVAARASVRRAHGGRDNGPILRRWTGHGGRDNGPILLRRTGQWSHPTTMDGTMAPSYWCEMLVSPNLKALYPAGIGCSVAFKQPVEQATTLHGDSGVFYTSCSNRRRVGWRSRAARALR